ncbi:MAG TPA: gephyrin-like molybdotransferase Glp [Nitrolancea sp.]
MLSVDEARARILSAFTPLPPVRLRLLDALGLVLAEDIQSPVNIPPFRNSAMDGFALFARETERTTPESPRTLRVSGEIAAGQAPTSELVPGTAMRIMTGAPLPAGADAVIRFEDVIEIGQTGASSDNASSNARIELSRAVRVSENVREAGEDVVAGSTVLTAGTVIGPMQIGLLAAVGLAEVSVVRRPVVAILSTGNEVVEAGNELGPAQIRNSNGPMLAAMARQFGGEPRQLGIALDSEAALRERLSESGEADLLVTSGGVSVGDFDVVKQVLQRDGRIDLWQVRMKPGKPLAFGLMGGTPLLGLPGNPAAAAVAFCQFGRPAIRKMLGLSQLAPRTLRAKLAEDVENRGHRRHFVRGVIENEQGRRVVRPSSGGRGGALTGLAAANCFIVLSEECARARAGDVVDAELFDDTYLEPLS